MLDNTIIVMTIKDNFTTWNPWGAIISKIA